MQIASKVSMWSGARTRTAKDYVQSGLVAMWDGIENAGWGRHVSELPIKFGYRNLVNLANPTVTYGGADYDFGLNVVNMSVEDDGLAWNSTSAWAGWGAIFNNTQIDSTTALSIISSVMPTVNAVQEMTTELVCTCNAPLATPELSILVAGYNERAIYSSYSTNGSLTVRWNVGGAVRYSVVQSPLKTGPQSITIVQTATEGRVYIDGQLVFTRTGACGWFYLNMFAFLRANSIRSNYTPNGKFNTLRIYNRALTADEIAANYAIDKARFNLP